jgi:hypothetical protein
VYYSSVLIFRLLHVDDTSYFNSSMPPCAFSRPGNRMYTLQWQTVQQVTYNTPFSKSSILEPIHAGSSSLNLWRSFYFILDPFLFRLRVSFYIFKCHIWIFSTGFCTFLFITWFISPTCIFSIISVFYFLTKPGNSNSGRRKVNCAASDCWLSFIFCQLFNDAFSDLSSTAPGDRLIDES